MTEQHRTREDVVTGLARSAGSGKPAASGRVFRHAKDPASRPAPAPTNGGPRIYGSAVEELEDIGRTLYAPDAWIPRLARDIGEHPRQVRKWVSGQSKVPPIAVKRARMIVEEDSERRRKLRVRLGLIEA